MASISAETPGRPRIHFRVEGSGPHATLIHGVGADLGSWDEIAPVLARSFTVVRADLLGHGESERAAQTCTLADLAQGVRVVWNHLRIEKTDLAGFSLGGLIAQSLALSDPERIRRLAILSAVAGRTEEERAQVVDRLEVLKEQGIGGVTAAAEERWFTPEFRAAHPDRVRQRMAALLANDPTSYAAAYTVFATSDLGERLAKIRHPTLVTTGEHDRGSNPRMARLMHEKIHDSRLVILPGLRHSVLAEAPDRIAALLLAHFIA
ncbi:MAG: alpha/beta fold hydrolase [Acetobacteraceae bacterium]